MPTDHEICRMDAVTLANNIRAKELSPVEVVDAELARTPLTLQFSLQTLGCVPWTLLKARRICPCKILRKYAKTKMGKSWAEVECPLRRKRPSIRIRLEGNMPLILH